MYEAIDPQSHSKGIAGMLSFAHNPVETTRITVATMGKSNTALKLQRAGDKVDPACRPPFRMAWWW